VHSNPVIKKISIFTSLFLLASAGAWAQGNLSPYSQMGIGDLEDAYYNRTTGLGNTGLAYRSNRFLINNNPASFSALVDQYFTAETGLRASLINYYGTPVDPSSTQSGDITFRRLVMGIKASKHWGTSAGLVPFSTENYEFSVPYNLQGSTTEIANNYYQGHGSINKVYWANSYEFFHHISLGIDAAYLFGQLNQKNILQSPVNGASLVSTTNEVNITNLYMTYGMQIYGNLGKKLTYSLGGVFSNQTKLFSSTRRMVQGPDSSILQNVLVSETYLTLPVSYGAGFQLTYKDKYTLVGDYKHQDWNSVSNVNNYPGKDYSLSNSDRASLGFEISKKKVFYNTRVELSYIQTGLYYGNTYLQINGQQIKDMGITAGFGVNSIKNSLAYSIILQYGIKGTQDNNLIQQRYTNVTFLINYGALWYTKGKKYD
jgi:hypothetical protein